MHREETGWDAEPSIEDVMLDPVVCAVMRSDGLTAEDVWRVVESASAALRARGPAVAPGA